MADALEAYVQTLPLGGAKTRLTKEVEEWAAKTGRALPRAELLDIYNREAEAAPGRLREELREYASDGAGKLALISLLGRPGANDEVRLAALDALQYSIAAGDAAELARINTGQRPQVLPRALEVLAATECATALFALRKVYTRREDLGGRAEELAVALAATLPAAKALEDGRALLEGARRLDHSELLLAILSLDPTRQAGLREHADGRAALELLTQAAVELAEHLQSETRRTGALGRFQSRLRDELFEFVLIAEMSGGGLDRRAFENLFRRDDLEDVAQTLENLPGPTLEQFVERALTRSNRRNRPERAVVALRSLRGRPQQLSLLRSDLVESLGDENIAVRLESALTLAVEVEPLEPSARRKLLTTYEELPATSQDRLASALDLSAISSPSDDVSRQAVSAWVAAAPEGQHWSRIDYLLDVWSARGWPVVDAGGLSVTLGAQIERCEPAQAEAASHRMVDLAATWLRNQPGIGRVRQATKGLLEWSHFAAAALRDIDLLADRLRAPQARVLLEEILATPPQPRQELLLAATEPSLDPVHEQRILLPVLASAVSTATDQARAAFGRATATGQQRLLTAGLLALKEASGAIDALEEARRSGATEELVRRRDVLLRELTAAEEAAAGNDRLLELLQAIRLAVGGEAPEDAMRRPEGANEAGTPEPVSAWRVATAEKYAGMVEAPDEGRQALSPKGDPRDRPEDVASLLLELDKRAHSTRVAPARDREFYLRDLEALVASVVDAGMLQAAGDGGPVAAALARRSSTLGELAWSQWAERGQPSIDRDGLAQAVLAAAEGDDRGTALLERGLKGSSTDELRQLASSLEDDERRVAWEFVARRLERDGKRATALRREVRAQGQRAARDIAEHLDLPFKIIETLLFSYFRLRGRLAETGWFQVEPTLGKQLSREQLDPAKHQVEGDVTAEVFEVQTLGIRIDRDTVARAVVRASAVGQTGSAGPPGEES